MRAARRHHLHRMKRRSEFIWRNIWGAPESKWPSQNANHIKKCSCMMCGNFRRNLGVTVQEKRAHASAQDEVYEWETENTSQ